MSDELVKEAKVTIYSGRLLVIDPENVLSNYEEELDLLMPVAQALAEKWRLEEEWKRKNCLSDSEFQKRREEHERRFKEFMVEREMGKCVDRNLLEKLTEESSFLMDEGRKHLFGPKEFSQKQMKNYKPKYSPPHLLQRAMYAFTMNWGENYFVVRTSHGIQIMHPSSETGKHLEVADVEQEGTLLGRYSIRLAQMICDAQFISLDNLSPESYQVIQVANGEYGCQFTRRNHVLEITPLRK